MLRKAVSLCLYIVYVFFIMAHYFFYCCVGEEESSVTIELKRLSNFLANEQLNPNRVVCGNFVLLLS